jgi:hypothetical protein
MAFERLTALLEYEKRGRNAPDAAVADLPRIERDAYREIKNGKRVFLGRSAFIAEFNRLGYKRVIADKFAGIWNIFSYEYRNNALFAKIFAACIFENNKKIEIEDILKEEHSPEFPIYLVEENAARFVRGK